MFKHVLAGLSHDGKMWARCSALRALSDVSCSPLNLSYKKRQHQLVIQCHCDTEILSPCYLASPVSRSWANTGSQKSKVASPQGMRWCPCVTLPMSLVVFRCHRIRRCHWMEEGKKFPSKKSRAHFLFLPFSSNKGSGTTLCSLGDFLLSTYINTRVLKAHS